MLKMTILVGRVFVGFSVASVCVQALSGETYQQARLSPIWIFSFGSWAMQYPSPLPFQMHPKPWFPLPIQLVLVGFGREVLAAPQRETHLDLPDDQQYSIAFATR